MSHQLPNLPYEMNALEPYISANTLSFHHGKHHKAYVDNLNNLIPGTAYETLSLEDVIQKTAHKASDVIGIFNNAAQIWNHTFFWHSMRAPKASSITGEMEKIIGRDFNSLQNFKDEFKKAALSQFGSGWAWFVLNPKTQKTEIVKTGNADTPITQGLIPLMTCDVWEHSYYLDYQNRRGDYVQDFLEYLVNWDFVQKNLHQK